MNRYRVNLTLLSTLVFLSAGCSDSKSGDAKTDGAAEDTIADSNQLEDTAEPEDIVADTNQLEDTAKQMAPVLEGTGHVPRQKQWHRLG